MAILGSLHILMVDVRVEISEFLYKKIIFQEISQALWGRIPTESNRGLPMAILGSLHILMVDVRVEISEFLYKKIIFQEISQALWGRIPTESNRGLPMVIIGPLHIPYKLLHILNNQ
jgi:hypothetical protein